MFPVDLIFFVACFCFAPCRFVDLCFTALFSPFYALSLRSCFFSSSGTFLTNQPPLFPPFLLAFEKFEQTAHAIQNGTSVEPPSPPNPVIPVIDALLEELQTVILGFHVALENVRNTIPELFSIQGTVPERDGGGAGADGEEDKMRIQPIDPGVDVENGKEKTRQNEEGFDASKVIIGKSKEQIKQALGEVPLVKHEEL